MLWCYRTQPFILRCYKIFTIFHFIHAHGLTQDYQKINQKFQFANFLQLDVLLLDFFFFFHTYVIFTEAIVLSSIFLACLISLKKTRISFVCHFPAFLCVFLLFHASLPLGIIFYSFFILMMIPIESSFSSKE